MRVARTLRESGRPERFVWTTGAWLIYEFLEQATPTARAEMEAAIAAGDIVWHGLPFTTHSELMDADLFRFGLSLFQSLDRRYGRHTIAAKMTDVPGHTRAIIPLLAEAGIQFLHIGVNAASTAPAVPPVFIWRHPSGAEVMVMYHKGSYGDLMEVPGLDEAIYFAHTGDNLGPQSPEEIQEVFAALRQRMPQAEPVASTMDAFAAALYSVRNNLPVVTAELGDTWIHGAGSDPQKLAAYRALLRLRKAWLAGGHATSEDARLHAFHRKLLVVPEHTWGLDVKTHLADWQAWNPADFATARSEPGFQKMEASWDEQRGYIRSAIKALGNGPQATGKRSRCRHAAPRPVTTGMQEVPIPVHAFHRLTLKSASIRAQAPSITWRNTPEMSIGQHPGIPWACSATKASVSPTTTATTGNMYRRTEQSPGGQSLTSSNLASKTATPNLASGCRSCKTFTRPLTTRARGLCLTWPAIPLPIAALAALAGSQSKSRCSMPAQNLR
ncbi:MAG: DUF5054 domain-containing protein [Anaerolineales bacterium]|nr:DUF5054 domain-containing protein [Anaerolineales bacterium]